MNMLGNARSLPAFGPMFHTALSSSVSPLLFILQRKNVRRAHFADSDEEAGSGSDKPDESDNNEMDEKEDIANELFGDDDDEEEEDEDASQKVMNLEKHGSDSRRMATSKL